MKPTKLIAAFILLIACAHSAAAQIPAPGATGRCMAGQVPVYDPDNQMFNCLTLEDILPAGSMRLWYANTTIPAGNTVANTAAETAFATMPPAFPANSLKVGEVIHLKANGTYSTALLAPSVTGSVKFNQGGPGEVLLGTTGSILNAASLSNRKWGGELTITILSLGASGTAEVQGDLYMSTTVGTQLSMPILNTAVVGINTTIPNTPALTIRFSLASINNTATLRQFYCWKSSN